jgi:hypothetical protein
MSPKESIRQELTWTWAYSTGHQASDQRLEAAARAAWPYAMLCAWTYLNDHHAAHDLMDLAVERTSEYALRQPDLPLKKLVWRMKSVIRRSARQQVARRRFEVSYGSLLDVENLHFVGPDAEERVYVEELLNRLTPLAQSIAKWRSLGFSWREIGRQLEMDHTVVRRAFFREIASSLKALSGFEGESK